MEDNSIHIDELKFLGLPSIGYMTINIENFAVDLMYFNCAAASTYKVDPKTIYNNFNIDRDAVALCTYINNIISDFCDLPTEIEFESAELVSKNIIEDDILYNARIDKSLPLDSEALLFTFFITNI